MSRRADTFRDILMPGPPYPTTAPASGFVRGESRASRDPQSPRFEHGDAHRGRATKEDAVNGDLDTAAEEALAFGPFLLFRRAKLLTENGRPVRLGRRALDILSTLAEQEGRVVSKNELIAKVWPRAVVEETNLRVNLHALRKILGDGQSGVRYIVNVAGRGYQFVGTVTTVYARPSLPANPRQGLAPLPARPTRAVGRDEVIHDLVMQASRRRLITIVGTGGVGKSTVAIAVAERLAADSNHTLCFVDFSG